MRKGVQNLLHFFDISLIGTAQQINPDISKIKLKGYPHIRLSLGGIAALWTSTLSRKNLSGVRVYRPLRPSDISSILTYEIYSFVFPQRARCGFRFGSVIYNVL